jgi:hypothetical protein
MRQITPRIQQLSKAHEAIGKVLNSNCFATLKGKLIYIENGKCYFEIIENPDYPKYNHCAGKIEYLPEHMVVCEKFEEEDEGI